jgi:hypothetical protein
MLLAKMLATVKAGEEAGPPPIEGEVIPIMPLLKIIGSAGSGRDPTQQHRPMESSGSD